MVELGTDVFVLSLKVFLNGVGDGVGEVQGCEPVIEGVCVALDAD
jgi:hypothetical protein